MDSTAEITQVFNVSVGDVSRQPALQFERDTGLQGIARIYHLPKGVTGEMFESLFFWTDKGRPAIFDRVNLPESRMTQLTGDIHTTISRSSPQFTALMGRAWDDLAQLNPALNSVKVDKSSPNQLYDALLGVASSFNTDDINFYLHTRWVEDAAVSAITARTGVRPQCIVSPATIKRINDQLDRKGVAPAFRAQPAPSRS